MLVILVDLLLFGTVLEQLGGLVIVLVVPLRLVGSCIVCHLLFLLRGYFS